jgi:hypothetical protein
MNGAHSSQGDPDSHNLAVLCADHVRGEEALLAAALPLVRAVQEALNARGAGALATALAGHQEFSRLIEQMSLRRQRFRETLAGRLKIAPRDVTLARALATMPAASQAAIGAAAARARRLADDLAAANYGISIHLRIHLEAYQRILRDLTSTAAGSGRYGPAGQTESLEYRPLIHIRG